MAKFKVFLEAVPAGMSPFVEVEADFASVEDRMLTFTNTGAGAAVAKFRDWVYYQKVMEPALEIAL